MIERDERKEKAKKWVRKDLSDETKNKLLYENEGALPDLGNRADKRKRDSAAQRLL
jgi:hypothetical protein